MGANPAHTPADDTSKHGILHLEEYLARELIRSLSAEQKEKAIFSDRAPFNIMSGTEKTIRQIDSKGIYFSELDKTQKGMLLLLIKLYVKNFENEFATKPMKKVEREDLNKITFAWAGGLDPGQGHYYPILASSTFIEYDNTQNNSNHVHTEFRDIKNYFGEDFLLNHYKKSEHHN